MSTPNSQPTSSPEKDTQTWVTGDEPMTGAQKSYLTTLGNQTHTEVPEQMTKAQASEEIDELQQRSGRTGKAASTATTPVNNAEKDPSTWVTGAEPMTGPQKSYIGTLSREAHVPVNDSLTKAEASMKIEELRSARQD